ncbi:MAG TPA: hypothetical protein VJS90_06040 [Pseudomonas sp.]|uniref:hypothetical protein n=1 Tax=Pseudomonas sp. TaxID=306 RepID=UPI002B4908A4|nr:hypothetical protein [Pseudomonas sp.]HKS12583.1 hypothetical protein [Pseudomonas sp.]
MLWKPEPLRLSGPWREDGPELPIEFCRVGDGGELATAICVNAPLVQVFWAPLEGDDLALACQRLKEREGIPDHRSDGVGSLVVSPDATGPLCQWALAKGLDALVWTALPPRFEQLESRVPCERDVLDYLASLQGETRAHAKRYIEQVPRQIQTPYRAAIARTLDWERGARGSG